METKKDMSPACEMRYEEYWAAVHIQKTMTQEDFDKWLRDNCCLCKFMNEICMKE